MIYEIEDQVVSLCPLQLHLSFHFFLGVHAYSRTLLTSVCLILLNNEESFILLSTFLFLSNTYRVNCITMLSSATICTAYRFYQLFCNRALTHLCSWQIKYVKKILKKRNIIMLFKMKSFTYN